MLRFECLRANAASIAASAGQRQILGRPGLSKDFPTSLSGICLESVILSLLICTDWCSGPRDGLRPITKKRGCPHSTSGSCRPSSSQRLPSMQVHRLFERVSCTDVRGTEWTPGKPTGRQGGVRKGFAKDHIRQVRYFYAAHCLVLVLAATAAATQTPLIINARC